MKVGDRVFIKFCGKFVIGKIVTAEYIDGCQIPILEIRVPDEERGGYSVICPYEDIQDIIPIKNMNKIRINFLRLLLK